MKVAVTFFALAASAWAAGVPATFSSRGVGGGGALYSPGINPVDANELHLSCDMSHGLYSLDGGVNWTTLDFRNYQVRQTSQMLFCTDSATGQHRLFTLDARQAGDESAVAKRVMSAIISGPMSANGATFTKVTGWSSSRFANQVFADPNQIDRVVAIESNAGNTTPRQPVRVRL